MHTRACGTDSTSYVRVAGNVAADPLGCVDPLTTAVHLKIRLVNGYGETVLEGKPANGVLVTAFNRGAPERGAIGSVVFDTIAPVPAGMSSAELPEGS